ncbi:Mu-like prophage tail protein gpP [Rhizobium sp. RU35A]|uniref:phage baseplate assembly protein n=1 Tax=Rhizobium sp. RU35A TaxID=1907414 RepID=UPI000955670C|nr:Mu P family protein [Rhizobium sp. RU35A]SIQ23770.1 Mu-like prophage tail protein gpP [Rhizobium sp. RU35A]
MGKSISLEIDGQRVDQWTAATVTRDLKDFCGSFDFTFRDRRRSGQALPYASFGPLLKLKPGPAVVIRIGRLPILKGYIETVEPEIEDGRASVRIAGRDVTGDLIDCAAMLDAAEFRDVSFEEAAARIVRPYGIGVRTEVDTGDPFPRYAIDLAETAFSAIEKGARARQLLVVSDGVGGIVVTRTGKTRAPAPIRQPGNVLAARGVFTHAARHSQTVVRGQAEGAASKRGAARLDTTAEPIDAGSRSSGDGSATERERRGVTATGRATDDEISRYRPIVHLARSKADAKAAQTEADWRSRTARAAAEEFTVTVRGHTVDGAVWTVNQLADCAIAYVDIDRELLISRVAYSEDEQRGATTEITLCSPEAFDAEPVGNRRKNRKAKTGALDGTAEAL